MENDEFNVELLPQLLRLKIYSTKFQSTTVFFLGVHPRGCYSLVVELINFTCVHKSQIQSLMSPTTTTKKVSGDKNVCPGNPESCNQSE